MNASKEMMGKYNDFSALKALKKDLQKIDTSGKEAAPQQQRRIHTVVNKPKEQMEGERVAKERGLRPGCKEEDTVLIIGAGPTGICTLLCVMLKHPKHIIVCEKSEERRAFVKDHYPDVIVTTPQECTACTGAYGAPRGGVDGCDCAEILSLIEQGLIDTTPLITHRYKLEDIEEAYRVFENREDGVIKVAIICA